MSRAASSVPATLTLVILAAGCSPKSLSGGEPAEITCSTCHGTGDDAAPPKALGGGTDPALMGVGAHQAHLKDSAIARAVACADCHPVPSRSEDPPHHDGKTDLVFSVLARTSGLAPRFDVKTGACASTWCHGTALKGGTTPTPVWNAVGVGQAACGACHGVPPPAPHAQAAHCFACHDGTVNADDTINVAAGLHVNGKIDGKKNHAPGFSDPGQHGAQANAGLSACTVCHGEDLAGGSSAVACTECHLPDWRTRCTYCHGGTDNATGAPPVGVNGNVATTDVTVGAHTAHLAASAIGKAVACSECHVVPADLIAAGHMDGAATLTFGALATSGGATPSWTRSNATCASTWCHGAKLGGGTLKNPIWTRVDGTQAACGTCHGNPPPPPHAVGVDCSVCHPATVRPDGTIDVASGAHLNGSIESVAGHPAGWAADHGPAAKRGLEVCAACHGAALDGGIAGVSCNACHDGWRTNCSYCHGGKDNTTGAPPVDTKGGTATTLASVGAHSAHLADGALRKAIACAECHVVPTDALSANHVDEDPKVAFGTLARAQGQAPRWDRASKTCASTYCHGAAAWGGSNKTPLWTKVDGTQAACGTCHGNPPADPHPQDPACTKCHMATVKADGSIDVAGGKHVDGLLQVSDAHPVGWEAGAVHGSQANAGLARCQFCHGEDLAGAEPAPTCNGCHTGWRTNCTFCHGGVDGPSGAPPAAVAGGTATTLTAVGAHTAHLAATSALARPVACAECHAVPTDALSPGHVDAANATLTFGALSRAKGAQPTWDRAGGKCSSTYCHGATLKSGAGTVTAPTWTTVDGTQDACGTCHGLPPRGSYAGYPVEGGTFSHLQQSHLAFACSRCHPDVSVTKVITDPAIHVDGKTDVISAAANCSCHN